MADEILPKVWSKWPHPMPPQLADLAPWFWVTDGKDVWPAQYDGNASGGWTNSDTWEDFTKVVTHFMPIESPQFLPGLTESNTTAPAFCRDCGAPMIEEWTGYYRATDGQKDMHLICSAQPCEHGAHWHSKVIKTIPNRWWNPLHNGGVVKQCKRCDHTWTDWNFSDY